MVILHSASSTSGDMEWSADGENTDCSTTSSPPTSSNRRSHHQNQEHDSLSDEDDLSDEFSLVDSDEDKKTEARYNQQILQVSGDYCVPFGVNLNFFYLASSRVSGTRDSEKDVF